MSEIARYLDLDKSDTGRKLATDMTRDAELRIRDLVEDLRPSEARQLAVLAGRVLGSLGQNV
jgi:hypothetical protein